MSLIRVLKSILSHPLNKDRKIDALVRFGRWQLGARVLRAPALHTLVNQTRIIVKKGMTGATGNLYCGLHEFEDMAFLLHFLRKEDLFFDIGANIGSYTLLASGGVGSKTICVEPIPSTFNSLLDNIHINNLTKKVHPLNVGVGKKSGSLSFSSNQDTTNHVLPTNNNSDSALSVDVITLEKLVKDQIPSLIKIDVEGFETAVVEGALPLFKKPDLKAVILELNGSGQKYGFNEDALHQQMLDLGFASYCYAPFERSLTKTTSRNQIGNTLYLRDLQTITKRVQGAARYTVGSHKL